MLTKYIVSDKLCQLLGFDEAIQMIQFILKNNLPNFSVPDDYISFARETFKCLLDENIYIFKSRLSNIKGHSFLIQEQMKSYHFTDQDMIFVVHNFNFIEKL